MGFQMLARIHPSQEDQKGFGHLRRAQRLTTRPMFRRLSWGLLDREMMLELNSQESQWACLWSRAQESAFRRGPSLLGVRSFFQHRPASQRRCFQLGSPCKTGRRF